MTKDIEKTSWTLNAEKNKELRESLKEPFRKWKESLQADRDEGITWGQKESQRKQQENLNGKTPVK